MDAQNERRVPRRAADYLTDLRDQLELLRNAAQRYDDGSTAEAMNLAVRLRVLLHDGKGRSRSLLGQLGIKDRLPYLDTALVEAPRGVIQQHGGLCIISARLGPGGSSRYAAPLSNLSPDRRHPPSSFSDWWETPVVVTNETGTPFSRQMFVRALADQDGGAHVDAELDHAYADVAREGLRGFQPVSLDDPRAKNLALPSVRQIAFELERTLADQLVEDQTAPFGVRVREPICSLRINAAVTVGRNDPCPCNSGRKMKHCYGRRERRRRISMEEMLRDTG